MVNTESINPGESAGTDKPPHYDVVVIGGGINGAGIARDAVGRGLSVLLCEQDDLAQHTSSSSTKLIHGGLRYLEHYDFALVRHALIEREVLLRAAPHIIWPLRFILPHHRDLRPRWLIRAGLFLYDHLGGRKLLPGSHAVNLRKHVSGKALKQQFTHAFEYSDCWVQDSRLVVLNACDASARGAKICVRTRCTDLTRHADHWQVQLQQRNHDGDLQPASVCTARTVVNASGPWVERTLNLDASSDNEHGVRLVKGSHVIVPRLFEHEYTYIFQNADNRVLFAVPYEQDYTLLGTTDIEVEGDPYDVAIEQREIDYICDAVSQYFEQKVDPASVVWSYSGVRPLYDDSASNASKVTRDYKLHLDSDAAPVLSVYGGKITTFRRLAEEAVEMLQPALGFSAGNWTSTEALPGGDIPNADFDTFATQCRERYAWLDESLLLDYARNYGTRIHVLLEGCTVAADLGHHFGGKLYEREVQYLVEHEWAMRAEDVLWRRTKKGLHLAPGQAADITATLDDYMREYAASLPAAAAADRSGDSQTAYQQVS